MTPVSRRLLAALAASALLGSTAPAQVSRYELGLRLRHLERRLATAAPAPQQAALRELERAVQAFFRLDTKAVAEAIDNAELRLDPTPPSDAARAARALQLVLHERLVDPGLGTFAADLALAFPPATELPAGLRVSVRAADRELLAPQELGELPQLLDLRLAGLPPGDHALEWTVWQGDAALATRSQSLSVVRDRGRRLDALPDAAPEREATEDLDRASLRGLVRTLRQMTRRQGEETVLPGARLLDEAEALAKAIASGKPFYGAQTPGDHWLRVPVRGRPQVVRVQVPGDRPGPWPVVCALHGAGGSENLFCDGYGDGLITRLCQARGWLLLAPRSDGFAGTDLPPLLDELAARFPLDRDRVLVVGHSMGAGQAIANAVRAPERFRAIAALGGGGAVRRREGLERLPCFVAAGERDFGRAGALQLHRQWQAQGGPSTWREYPHVEHLAIVQFALPDVFAWFDAQLAPR